MRNTSQCNDTVPSRGLFCVLYMCREREREVEKRKKQQQECVAVFPHVCVPVAIVSQHNNITLAVTL